MLDLTRLTFDQFNCNIMQERRKYYARNTVKPLSMTTKKEIVLNTMINHEMIALSRTTFVTVTELNVGKINKQIAKLQGKLYASEQRDSIAEDRRRLEEWNIALILAHSSTKGLQAPIKEEVETLRGAMEVFYEEMLKLHHIMSPYYPYKPTRKKNPPC